MRYHGGGVLLNKSLIPVVRRNRLAKSRFRLGLDHSFIIIYTLLEPKTLSSTQAL